MPASLTTTWPATVRLLVLGKSGYTFAVTPTAAVAGGAPATFYTTATPLSNTTGAKAFCAYEDGVLRSQAAEPSPWSPATQLAAP